MFIKSKLNFTIRITWPSRDQKMGRILLVLVCSVGFSVIEPDFDQNEPENDQNY